MELNFKCGYCKKEGSNPSFSKNGKTLKCEHCGKWQTFKGSMEIIR